MARVWLPPQSDPWLALREPALLVPNRLPIGSVVLRADGLTLGLTACLVADGGSLRDIVENVSPSVDAASGERVILGAVGPEYSGGSGVNTRFANESRFAPVNGTGLTIAAWFDVDTLTNYSAIAAFQQTTTTDGWELRLGGSGGITGSDISWANMNAAGIRTWRSGAARYSAGQRSAFIAISREGNAVDTAPLMHWGTGSVVASISVGGAVGDMTVPASRELYVGHRYDNVTRLDGAVGMLLIYDRALSVAELDALYSRGPAALFEPAANEPIFIGTAAGGTTKTAVVTIAAQSTVAVAGVATKTAQVAVTAASTVAVTGAAIRPAIVTIAAQSTVAVIAGIAAATKTAVVAISAQSVATIAAVAIRSAVVSIAAHSVTTIAAVATRAAVVTIAAQSTVAVVAVNAGSIKAAAVTIAAQSLVSAVAVAIRSVVVGIAGAATATVVGVKTAVAQVAILAQSLVSTVAVSVGTRLATVLIQSQSLIAVTAGTVGVQWTEVSASTATWSDVSPASTIWTEIT